MKTDIHYFLSIRQIFFAVLFSWEPVQYYLLRAVADGAPAPPPPGGAHAPAPPEATPVHIAAAAAGPAAAPCRVSETWLTKTILVTTYKADVVLYY